MTVNVKGSFCLRDPSVGDVGGLRGSSFVMQTRRKIWSDTIANSAYIDVSLQAYKAAHDFGRL
jgi:hypothetical protein